jgi:uncharacterized cupin superfamily protein
VTQLGDQSAMWQERNQTVGNDQTVLDGAALEKGYRPFIVEGAETGQLSELTGADDVRAGVYRVREGEYPDRTSVPYFFETDEYIWVIEGEVHVVNEEGELTILRSGDSAFFRKGSESAWTFHAPFRKFSVEVGVDR